MCADARSRATCTLNVPNGLSSVTTASAACCTPSPARPCWCNWMEFVTTMSMVLTRMVSSWSDRSHQHDVVDGAEVRRVPPLHRTRQCCFTGASPTTRRGSMRPSRRHRAPLSRHVNQRGRREGAHCSAPRASTADAAGDDQHLVHAAEPPGVSWPRPGASSASSARVLAAGTDRRDSQQQQHQLLRASWKRGPVRHGQFFRPRRKEQRRWLGARKVRQARNRRGSEIDEVVGGAMGGPERPRAAGVVQPSGNRTHPADPLCHGRTPPAPLRGRRACSG